MVRINDKTIDDFLAKAQETLQNSLIETGYSLTYSTGTLNYILPGFATNNERIFSIDSIEGTGFLPENYLTEDNLIEGVDYSLYDNYPSIERVPDGYGTASGNQVYTGITIADQTFKDNTVVHIKYKYQNLNYVPILTNFSPNSVLRMILTASLINTQETNSELTQSIDSFGLNASGTDLDRIATLVGLERTDADSTTGQVKLYNNDTVNNYSVSTSHRFVALSGGTSLAFAPATSISVPKWDGTTAHDDRLDFVFVDVIATEAGSYYNVGSNSISTGFTNSELTGRTPTTLIISNPPLGDIGQQNLFDNGTDEETDDDFRKRISVTFSQAKTSSYSTIETAVINTGFVNHVNVFDIDLKKNLAENVIETFVATETGARLSSSSLSQILDAIALIKPAGSRPSIRQTLNNYVNFDFNIYVNQETIGDTTSLETELNNLIDEFINTKGIGEDILPSTVVSILKTVGDVKDIEINSHTTTEFTSEVATYDGTITLASGGAATNWIAIEVPFNSATNTVYDTEVDIANDIYELDIYGEPFPIDDRTQPRINIGIVGYDGLVRPSPLDRTDYRDAVATRTDMSYDPLTLGGDGIAESDLVLFNYNYFDNTLLDGFRIRLGGDADSQVTVDFGHGNDPDAFASIITPVVVNVDGGEKIYDVPLASQLECNNDPTHSPEADTFWLLLKYTGGTGDCHLPVDTTESTLAFNPALYIDDDAAGGGTFTDVSQQRANWHSYTTTIDANAYKKIVIPSQTDEPEKPISYTHTYNFLLFVEE